jgi:hypothetical protein
MQAAAMQRVCVHCTQQHCTQQHCWGPLNRYPSLWPPPATIWNLGIASAGAGTTVRVCMGVSLMTIQSYLV